MNLLPVTFRWIIRRDMPTIVEIESASFEFCWTESDFSRCLHQRNCIGLVAECEDRVVGYAIYELLPARVHLLNLAVALDDRRRRVGSQILRRLMGKLTRERRPRIAAEVRESNLPAQLFLRHCGFRATRILPRHFDGIEESAYAFVYRVGRLDPDEIVLGTGWHPEPKELCR